MPRAPSVKLNQALTHRKAKMSRTCFVPTLQALDQETFSNHQTQDDLLDAMTETMVYGIKVANGIDPGEVDPGLKEDFPHVFHPSPGRQLWGWSDVNRLAGGTDYRQTSGISLRPSDRPITPLHAFTSVRDRASDVRILATELASTKISHHQVAAYLQWQDFGHPHNEDYFRTDRHHISYEPTLNSKRSAAQHYALQLDPSGSQPIQATLVQYPPVYQELSDKLDEAYQEARLDLQSGPNNKWVKATHHLIQSPVLPAKVARIVLGQHDYNGPTPWNRLYDDGIHPGEHAELMVARQVTQRLFHTYAINPYITLAISLLTGTSPASFALAAIDRLERTASTFLTEGCILKMVDACTLLPEPRGAFQVEQREAFVDQMETLARQMATAQDSIPASIAEEAYDMMHNKSRLLPWGRV